MTRHLRRFLIVLVAVAVLSMGTTVPDGWADDDGDDDDDGHGRFCSATAIVQFEACQHEVKDGFFSAKAICINVSDRAARQECFAEAKAARQEGTQLCRKQRAARKDLCELIGEERYDPQFDPADFTGEFTNLNLYFPLKIGNRWDYASRDGETNTVEVLNATKRIKDVTCIVVHDLVTKADGAEDTDDWYAQATNGDVHYCGEEVKDFETFDGDEPMAPELVSIDGSFKVGRDGDRSGIIFLGAPTKGVTYRQEFSVGNAEDAATVLSTSYGFGNAPELDAFVPKALAQLLCTNDCVVTSEFTPIEPGVFQRKYYAKGVGLFLEVNPATGGINKLIGCNVDPRCSSLPRP